MSRSPELKLSVPLTVGAHPVPVFEGLLTRKVEECMRARDPDFSLTMREYEALQTYIFNKLERGGQLEDAAGNVVPMDLLEESFREVLTGLIEKWCEGRWSKVKHSPLTSDLYSYMGTKAKTILNQVYGTPPKYRGRGHEHFGEGVPFENMLADKVDECRYEGQTFFELTPTEHNNLKEHIIFRLERNGKLEDAAGNVVPPDLLDEKFDEVLAGLITRWCAGRRRARRTKPYTLDLYQYLVNRIATILRKVYDAPGERGSEHFGESIPFEKLLASKVKECMAADETFFDLTMGEYDELKEYIILRLERNGELEDEEGKVVPYDLLDALFNEVITGLIAKWCSGRWAKAKPNPYIFELYGYMAKRVGTVLKRAYAAPELDIDDPEIAESLYYEAADMLDRVSPEELAELLQPLSALERQVLELRFGLTGGAPLGLEEIADEIFANKYYVTQILQGAFIKLQRGDTGWTVGQLPPDSSEEVLRRKVNECMSTGEPYFDLTPDEYNAIKEDIIRRLEEKGHLEDEEENIIPLDLLDAEFNKVLAGLIAKWCSGRWPKSQDRPFTFDLYIYLLHRTKVVLDQMYGAPEVDIYEPEVAEGLYEEIPDILARLGPEEIRMLLQILGPKERQMLELRYGLTGYNPLSLDELGERFGVSHQRVSKIIQSSLEKLRRLIERSGG